MHQKEIVHIGKNIKEAKKALIMLHGRGASADDILSLAPYLKVKDFAVFAPEATNNTWYPYSFLTPPVQNEPWLSSAISLIDELVRDIRANGISDDNIYFSGFSQGACLTLEYVTRNARTWGGIAAFSGGLIGDKLYLENYKGTFESTPFYIGSSDPDPHIPVERVRESAKIITSMRGKIELQIISGMGHTVSMNEIEAANRVVFGG
jgi:phospholipase/carboxylesterase